MKVSVIGAGSWGTAFALHLSRLELKTRLWVREKNVLKSLREVRENKDFLEGFLLPPGVAFTDDIEEALASVEVVFVAVPAKYCRAIYKEMAPFLSSHQVVVSLTKGIEEGSLLRMTEVMAEVFARYDSPRLAVLSGPSFSREVAQGHPTAVVIASDDEETGRNLQRLVSNLYFRAYTSRDVVGVELAGALKNVIAISSGISDGLDFGYNSRAALITRGLVEVMRLGLRLGGLAPTFYGLAGIGDLILTCTAPLSRNHFVGFELGKGRTLESITSGMKMVAEGIGTTLSALDLARREKVEMPIMEQVFQVLYEGKDPRSSLAELMSRTLKQEHVPHP